MCLLLNKLSESLPKSKFGTKVNLIGIQISIYHCSKSNGCCANFTANDIIKWINFFCYSELTFSAIINSRGLWKCKVIYSYTICCVLDVCQIERPKPTLALIFC